jgi:acyl-CoA thioesterase I
MPQMSRTVWATAFALALLMLSRPSLSDEIKVPGLSTACEIPTMEIGVPTVVPHLTQAIAKVEPIRVVAVGSSSTVGVGSSAPALNYPNQLDAILAQAFAGRRLIVINRGVSGEMAEMTVNRLKKIAVEDKPTLVLWQVGTNDALSGVPVSTFKTLVRDQIRWFKERRIDVVLVGLQYTPRHARNDHYIAIRDALQVVAIEEAVLYVRRFAAMQYLESTLGPKLLSSDELHLNDQGYRCMAEHIARILVISSFLNEPILASRSP